MENLFLDLGFSFMVSKFLPLLILLILGISSAYFSLKNLKNRLMRWVFILFVGLIPSTIYFSLFPIYEGDIANYGTRPTSHLSFPVKRTLTVFALPECPYCRESVKEINRLVKYKGEQTDIRYVVLSTDTAAADFYRKELDKKVKIEQTSLSVYISEITQGAYPTYSLSENGKLISCWSNSTFGAAAWDVIFVK